MSLNYIIAGLNHRTAPIAVRERCSFSREELGSALSHLGLVDTSEECFLVSTCNRTEIHAGLHASGTSLVKIRKLLEDKSAMGGGIIPHLYTHSGYDAVRHLFRVTASLDSMIVGEAQITGQVKNAFAAAHAEGFAGLFLKRLLNKALSVAKRIRCETGISDGLVSYGSVSVNLALKLFESLKGKRVVMVGAGKIGRMVVEAMERKGAEDLLILNRTLEKAEALAGTFSAGELTEDSLNEALLSADVIITSIEGKSLLSQAKVNGAMRKRRSRPLLLIDLGLPRNIEPAAGKITNAYLYDIDDMQSIIQKNLFHRQNEAKKAEEIAASQSKVFYSRLLQASAG